MRWVPWVEVGLLAIVVLAGAGDSRALAADGNAWSEAGTIETAGWLPASVAYSADGKMLVIGGTGGHVVALDARTHKEKWQASVASDLAAVAFSDDGEAVLATTRDGVQFLDARNGLPGHTLEEKDSRPTAIGVFPDRQIDVAGQPSLTFHKVVFANARTNFAKLWIEGAPVSTIEAKNVAAGVIVADPAAVPLAVDPQGRGAIAKGPVDRDLGMNILWVWSVGGESDESLGNQRLAGHEAEVVCAAWSGDGKTAVTGDAKGRVIVWSVPDLKETHRVQFTGRIAALALSHDGQQSAAVVVDQQAAFHVWDTGKPFDKKPLHPLAADFTGSNHASLAFSCDGKCLAGSAIDVAWLNRAGELVGKLHVWECSPAPPAAKQGR